MKTYNVEVTDTFGGEANYCWVRRHTIQANSMLGAVQKLSRSEGYAWRKDWDTGDEARYNAKGARVCCFVSESDEV